MHANVCMFDCLYMYVHMYIRLHAYFYLFRQLLLLCVFMCSLCGPYHIYFPPPDGRKNPINDVVAPSTFHTKCTPLCGFESVPSQGILYLKPTFNTIQITG